MWCDDSWNGTSSTDDGAVGSRALIRVFHNKVFFGHDISD